MDLPAVDFCVVIPRIFAALLVLPALILSSCVEGEEEIWIEPNGSGRLVIHYELPSLTRSQLGDPDEIMETLRLIDEKEEGLKIKDLTFTKSGRVVFHLEATFDDVLDLANIGARHEKELAESEIASPEQIAAASGEIDFKVEGMTPMFRRAVSLDSIFPDVVARRPGMLGSSNFKYTIHLPAKVKETDAHFVSEDKRTVSWTFLLKEHAIDPMVMNVTTGLPIPWWAWLIAALVIFALAWLLWKLVIRRFL